MSGLPTHAPGMRIGLYGGSFNPPHAAHLMVAKTALRRLDLDRVWLLVSPGNPLKKSSDLAPLDERVEQTRALMDDTRICVTALESALGTRYTIDTVSELTKQCRGVPFVWLMGADSFLNFHLWRDWRGIAEKVPFAVFDRPGFTHKALHGRAAQALARFRIDESDATLLPNLAPPAWVFVHGPRSTLSSTDLRAKSSRK